MKKICLLASLTSKMIGLVLMLAVGNTLMATTYGSKHSDCPCGDPKLCQPITDAGRKEVYAFSITNNETHWQRFDWSKITTVCMYNYLNASLMCLAHSYNVRAVVLGVVDKATIRDPSLRQKWVSDQLLIVQNNFLDGLNFDYEGTISTKEETLREGYISLVNETSIALKRLNPYAQVSVDVVFSPHFSSYDYGFPSLAKVADFLFIMAYDEKESVTGPYVAGPNSDYMTTKIGLESYLQDSNIPSSKLVLGLPWYGKIYNCIRVLQDQCFLSAEDRRLSHWDMNNNEGRRRSHWDMNNTEGRRLSHWDTNSGSYIFYNEIYMLLLSIPDKYMWNATSSTPFITFQNSSSGQTRQIQFDDPISLKFKYDLAASMGLRGVGIWTIDYLDYSDSDEGQKMRQSMFQQLP